MVLHDVKKIYGNNSFVITNFKLHLDYIYWQLEYKMYTYKKALQIYTRKNL